MQGNAVEPVDRRTTTPRGSGRAPSALPRWPLLAALYGLPVFWVLGALPFAYLGLATIMLAFLIARGGVRHLTGLGFYFAFLAWVTISGLNISGLGQAVGYLWRIGDLIAVGIAMLYYANAERISSHDLMRALTYTWVVIVGFGLLAGVFPEVRITTPFSYLLPEVIAGNPLVNELLNPRLAEVQQPWGVTEPYNRPAAPFPYTNSWGTAYVLLTPVALAFLLVTPRRIVKVGLALVLAASLVPAVATSNRGMFLGLGVIVVYTTIRLTLQGRVLPGVLLTLGSAGVLAVLQWSGAIADILGRQEYSDSTGTRSSVYSATFERTLESPLVGWGSPREEPGVEVALGTQGYIWTLMFSFGFIGLALFLLFLWGAVLRTARVATVSDVLIHAVLVATGVMILFYGLGSTQLFVVAMICVMRLRETADRLGRRG